MELEPARDLSQCVWLESQFVRPPTNGSRDDPGTFEHLEVLRHGWFRHAEPGRREADGCGPGCETFDNRAPHRVRERLETAVELERIVHQLVNNTAGNLAWPVRAVAQRGEVLVDARMLCELGSQLEGSSQMLDRIVIPSSQCLGACDVV